MTAVSAAPWGPGQWEARVPPGTPSKSRGRMNRGLMSSRKGPARVQVSQVMWKMLGFTFSHGAAQEPLGVTQPKDGARSSGQSLCPLPLSLHAINSGCSLTVPKDKVFGSWEQDELCTILWFVCSKAFYAAQGSTPHGVSPLLQVLPDCVSRVTAGASVQAPSSRQPRPRNAPSLSTQGQCRWERAVKSPQCHRQLCDTHKATSPKLLPQTGSSQLSSIPPEFAPLYLAGAFHPVGLKSSIHQRKVKMKPKLFRSCS